MILTTCLFSEEITAYEYFCESAPFLQFLVASDDAGMDMEKMMAGMGGMGAGGEDEGEDSDDGDDDDMPDLEPSA